MSLFEKINTDLKAAMMAKEKEKLEVLRSIKSALLLVSTEKGSTGEVTDDAAIKALQKLVKQRNDSAEMYIQQNRKDLADLESYQASVIETYLPKQMNEAEITTILQGLIKETGASSASDFGKVMGLASKQLAGKADGKKISEILKKILG